MQAFEESAIGAGTNLIKLRMLRRGELSARSRKGALKRGGQTSRWWAGRSASRQRAGEGD
jgi:hypothetical protein